MMMTTYIGNRETKVELESIQNGLHLAMDNLIDRKNYSEVERILRGIDARMADFINALHIMRPS